MCDPISLLAGAATIGGGALGAIGSVNAGNQADLGGQISAGVMADNARIQSGNADLTLGNVDMLKKQADVMRESGDLARARARVALARTQDQGTAAAGEQVAHFASSNLDATSGSPLLLQLLNASRVKGDQDLLSAGAEVERANIRTNAANLDTGAAGEAGKAAGMYSSAASTYGNALATQLRGGQARTAGQFGAATALLSTVPKLFGKGGSGDGSAFIPSASFLDHGFGFA
jgi:hypothetical protein